MRCLSPSLLLLLLLLLALPLGAAVVSCEPTTSFNKREALTVHDVSQRVHESADGTRTAYFDIRVSGAENGSESGRFLVSFDIIITAKTPQGQAVMLPDGGRVEYSHAADSRMHMIDIPDVNFAVPANAPDGNYTVTIEVVDKIGDQRASQTVAVEL